VKRSDPRWNGFSHENFLISQRHRARIMTLWRDNGLRFEITLHKIGALKL
jgi:hypothetical protein